MKLYADPVSTTSRTVLITADFMGGGATSPRLRSDIKETHAMKLYADPVSTTSRTVLITAHEVGVELELERVSLFENQQFRADYSNINPDRKVPTLVDGDFVLPECSAILKYLAERAGHPSYPTDIRERARVNQVMDWFNTGFQRDFIYGFVLPQVIPEQAWARPEVQRTVLDRGLERARGWLETLDQRLLAETPWLCGDAPTIADFLGGPFLSLAEWVGFDLVSYPAASRWLDRLRARPSWESTHGPWNALVAQLRAGAP